MKEAAGEANMTVITIVLIGLVAAAGAILIPQLLGGSAQKGCCASYGGTWENGACYQYTASGSKSQVAASSYYDSTNKKCK
jgi:hypothetical protein